MNSNAIMLSVCSIVWGGDKRAGSSWLPAFFLFQLETTDVYISLTTRMATTTLAMLEHEKFSQPLDGLPGGQVGVYKKNEDWPSYPNHQTQTEAQDKPRRKDLWRMEKMENIV